MTSEVIEIDLKFDENQIISEKVDFTLDLLNNLLFVN